jgi:HEAT repeat protein
MHRVAGRLIFCLGASGLLLSAVGSAEEGDKAQQALLRRRPEIEPTLKSIQQVLSAIRKNQASLEAAWPNRIEAQSRELPPPPAVQRYERELGQLEARKDQLLRELGWAVSRDQTVHGFQADPPRDIAPILAAVADATDVSFIDAVVPIVARACPVDTRLLRTLAKLAVKLEPTPRGLLLGLSELQREEAGILLLEIGAKQRDVGVLLSATKSGHVAVIRRLIELAEGRDAATASVALHALERMQPPNRIERNELRSLIGDTIARTRRPEVRTSLIAYLGQFREPADAAFFESLYHNAEGDPVRVAAVAALANSGGAKPAFFLDELADTANSTVIRRSCVHALGAIRHRPAAPRLIPLLRDPDFGVDAWHALARIVGRDLGVQPGPWKRWWSQQASAKKAGGQKARL